MSEAIIGNQIMTEDDYLALNKYRTEKDSDELVSHEDTLTLLLQEYQRTFSRRMMPRERY